MQSVHGALRRRELMAARPGRICFAGFREWRKPIQPDIRGGDGGIQALAQ